MMRFSEQELQEIINGNPIGNDWPYLSGSLKDVDSHLKTILQELNQSVALEVEGEFDSYGSGFASYAHLFCQKPKKGSTYRRDERTWTDGIAVYLNRLAPVAVLGPETRTVFERGSSHGFLDVDLVGETPDDTWEEEKEIITTILESEGLSLLQREDLQKPLPFKKEISTRFDEKTIFDALFYWED